MVQQGTHGEAIDPLDYLPGYERTPPMSMWSDNGLTDKVVSILSAVHLNNPEGHHFGRPFMSAYQIAIAMERDYPDTVAAIGKPIGGRGTGQHNSLSQYLSNELSKLIRDQGSAYPVEGAFFSNEHARGITFIRSTGDELISSLTGTDFDMALYRSRPT